MKTFKILLASMVIGLLVLGCDTKQEVEKVEEPATEQESPAQDNGNDQEEAPEDPAVNNNEEPESSNPDNSEEKPETPSSENPDDNQTPENTNEDPQPETPEEPEFDDPEAGLPAYEFLANEAPSALSAAQKEQLSKLNSFAFSFAGLMDEKKGNNSFVFSPVSLAYLLGMISEGADGATRREICTSLGFGPDSQQEINEFCRDLMVLASRAASKDEVLEIANVAVLNKDFKLLESYRKSVKNYYDAGAFNLDFTTQDVAGYVNGWASKHTNGVIKKVLDDVDPSFRAILMNALYFNAKWVMPFDDFMTAEGDFTGDDGKVRKEMMMSSDPEHFKYAKLDGFSALRLDYGKGDHCTAGNYCMYIMLPDKGVSATQLLNKLDKSMWAKMKSSLKYEYAFVKMPKFEVELDEDLSEVLKTLGMKTMFSASADFSRMSEENMSLNFVKQVAKINVNETGTVAAVVSVGGWYTSSGIEPEPVRFIADHPFLFAIEEKTTGTILFMGSYK